MMRALPRATLHVDWRFDATRMVALKRARGSRFRQSGFGYRSASIGTLGYKAGYSRGWGHIAAVFALCGASSLPHAFCSARRLCSSFPLVLGPLFAPGLSEPTTSAVSAFSQRLCKQSNIVDIA